MSCPRYRTRAITIAKSAGPREFAAIALAAVLIGAAVAVVVFCLAPPQ